MRRLGYDPARARRAAKEGCYIATAVYGSYGCSQVWVLRRYRDGVLTNRALGRLFIRVYYAVSPSLVKWFANMSWFNRLLKPLLDRLVNHLNDNGFSDEPYSGK